MAGSGAPVGLELHGRGQLCGDRTLLCGRERHARGLGAARERTALWREDAFIAGLGTWRGCSLVFSFWLFSFFFFILWHGALARVLRCTRSTSARVETTDRGYEPCMCFSQASVYLVPQCQWGVVDVQYSICFLFDSIYHIYFFKLYFDDRTLL